MSKNKFNTDNNLIAVIFTSTDQRINFSLSCSILENFASIEEKLFKQFPKLKCKNIYYLANGGVVNKNLTLK